jgi:hypothetical protein
MVLIAWHYREMVNNFNAIATVIVNNRLWRFFSGFNDKFYERFPSMKPVCV